MPTKVSLESDDGLAIDLAEVDAPLVDVADIVARLADSGPAIVATPCGAQVGIGTSLTARTDFNDDEITAVHDVVTFALSELGVTKRRLVQSVDGVCILDPIVFSKLAVADEHSTGTFALQLPDQFAESGMPSPGLREYWLSGDGAAKIRWGTPGDFTRCVSFLSEHVPDPKGTCANLHHDANGMWPGDRRNPGMKAAADTEEFHQQGQHDQKSHGNRAGSTGRAADIIAEHPQTIPLEALGVEPASADLAEIANSTRDDDELWNTTPVTKVPGDAKFYGTEESVKTAPIRSVVLDGEPLREGYAPRLYELEDGGYLIADGHHRVAMHALLDSDGFEAHVRSLPGQGRATKALAEIESGKAASSFEHNGSTVEVEIDSSSSRHYWTVRRQGRTWSGVAESRQAAIDALRKTMPKDELGADTEDFHFQGQHDQKSHGRRGAVGRALEWITGPGGESPLGPANAITNPDLTPQEVLDQHTVLRRRAAQIVLPNRADMTSRAGQMFGRGQGDVEEALDVMFKNGALKTTVPFRSATRRKSEPLYDEALVAETLSQPRVLREVDPRVLHATQSGITREGVRYYLGSQYNNTGRTFADQYNRGNVNPVVYRTSAGEWALLSGHHRAAAALLQGRPLEAVVIDPAVGAPPPRIRSFRLAVAH